MKQKRPWGDVHVQLGGTGEQAAAVERDRLQIVPTLVPHLGADLGVCRKDRMCGAGAASAPGPPKPPMLLVRSGLGAKQRKHDVFDANTLAP
eukprot:2524978-Prymnesium_polylepis.1